MLEAGVEGKKNQGGEPACPLPMKSWAKAKVSAPYQHQWALGGGMLKRENLDQQLRIPRPCPNSATSRCVTRGRHLPALGFSLSTQRHKEKEKHVKHGIQRHE